MKLHFKFDTKRLMDCMIEKRVQLNYEKLRPIYHIPTLNFKNKYELYFWVLFMSLETIEKGNPYGLKV